MFHLGDIKIEVSSSIRRKYVYIPIPEILCMFLYLYARLTFVLELLQNTSITDRYVNLSSSLVPYKNKM